ASITSSSRNSSQSNNFQPKVDSNPIAPRVRRKRQRLPPNLLIENASDRDPPPRKKSAPRRFRSRLAAIRVEHAKQRQGPCLGPVRKTPEQHKHCKQQQDAGRDRRLVAA